MQDALPDIQQRAKQKFAELRREGERKQVVEEKNDQDKQLIKLGIIWLGHMDELLRLNKALEEKEKDLPLLTNEHKKVSEILSLTKKGLETRKKGFFERVREARESYRGVVVIAQRIARYYGEMMQILGEQKREGAYLRMQVDKMRRERPTEETATLERRVMAKEGSIAALRKTIQDQDYHLKFQILPSLEGGKALFTTDAWKKLEVFSVQQWILFLEEMLTALGSYQSVQGYVKKMNEERGAITRELTRLGQSIDQEREMWKGMIREEFARAESL